MYLIDTNVISESRRGSAAHVGVRAFFHRCAQQGTPLYLPVITVGELRRGVELIRYRGDTAQADRLTGAATDAAAAVEIHETTMENDVMSMHPVDGIDIAAGESVSLAPGGLHIMLIGLQRNLIAGEKLDLTLTFEKAGQVSVEAEIRQP